MSSLASGITSIFEGISSLGSTIVNGIGEFFSQLLNYLNPFSEDFILKVLFDWIKDLIYEVFIPNTDDINAQFNSTMSNLNGRLGITMYNLDNLFDSSAAPSDIHADYYISGVGTLNLPFADYKFLADGVDFFRPFIRGLLVLLLFFFNVRQLMSMFGLSSGELANYSSEKGGDKK